MNAKQISESKTIPWKKHEQTAHMKFQNEATKLISKKPVLLLESSSPNTALYTQKLLI